MLKPPTYQNKKRPSLPSTPTQKYNHKICRFYLIKRSNKNYKINSTGYHSCILTQLHQVTPESEKLFLKIFKNLSQCKTCIVKSIDLCMTSVARKGYLPDQEFSEK